MKKSYDEKIANELDAADRPFGTGWISGVSGLFFAVAGLATVCCFCFPSLLTVENVREFYVENHLPIRAIVPVVLILAFVLGINSATLRQQKTLGFCTLAIVLLATLLGGSHASARIDNESPVYLGLDFFVLNLIFLGAVFIPIERLLKKNEQPILRFTFRSLIWRSEHGTCPTIAGRLVMVSAAIRFPPVFYGNSYTHLCRENLRKMTTKPTQRLDSRSIISTPWKFGAGLSSPNAIKFND